MSLIKRLTIDPSGNDSLTTTVFPSGNSNRSTGASGTTLVSQLPREGLPPENLSQLYFTSADVTVRPFTGGRGSQLIPRRTLKGSRSPARAHSPEGAAAGSTEPSRGRGAGPP